MLAVRRTGSEGEQRLWDELARLGLTFEADFAPMRPLRRRVDVAFPSERLAVYVDGCFWHSCPVHGTLPKANRTWWRSKLAANRERDRTSNSLLRQAGWNVVRVWEHQDMRRVAKRILRTLDAKTATPSQAGPARIRTERTCINEALAILDSFSTESKLVVSYARMNPGARITKNSFTFGTGGARRRVVLFGPWLYVRAPEHLLPSGVEKMSVDERRRRHLGALAARIRATEPSNLELVRRLCLALTAEGQASPSRKANHSRGAGRSAVPRNRN